MTALRVIKRPRAALPIPIADMNSAVGHDVLVVAGELRVRGQLDELKTCAFVHVLGHEPIRSYRIDKIVVYS